MTATELAAGPDVLGKGVAQLRGATPTRRDKAEVYRRLNLRLTYQPATQTVRAEANLNPEGRGVMGSVRGGFDPITPCLVLTTECTDTCTPSPWSTARPRGPQR
jgi:hypothetical protein